ncbi:MAG TPA: ABC transporter permease [Ilumatobacteraceae bacterium]|nr:ABC transporter permease [Ilumatobacteraceae bacterium]
MLLAALRDLQWRRKRFAITVIGTALVFSMGLLMSGLSNAFTVEVDRTLQQSGGDRWVAPTGAAGPFSAGISIPLDGFDAARGAAGVERADPVLFTRTVADVDGKGIDINLFGVVPGGLGAPQASLGRGPTDTGEALVAKKLASVGESIVILGRSFSVVGTVDKASLIAGAPSAFLVLGDAQTLVANGQNVASMIVTKGVPTALPVGLTAFDSSQTKADLARPLKNATQSIDFIRALLWMVAALIVASVIYLSALERTRDFAVFKATGVPTTAIAAGLALQAVVIALAASIVGAVLALLIAPRFPMDVVISSGSLLFMPVLAVIVGLVSSLVGLRRIAQVQPAVAFGGP